MSAAFTAQDQAHSLILSFGGSGVDLHGATITARVKVPTRGIAAFMQIYTQDTSFRSDYYQGPNFTNTFPAGYFDLVYHPPATPPTDPDGGAVTYDSTKIRQLLIEVKAAAPPDGGATEPTVIWVDSVTITNAPPPAGGGSYTPYTFDNNIMPFTDNGGTAGVTSSVTWIP